MTFNLCQHFSQYFSLSIADNETLLQEVYKIRYEVYCEELNYEPPENFPDRMETDIYDKHSVHCLLKHKSTGTYAGCVRIIMPNNELTTKPAYPWQKFASSIVYPHSQYEWNNLCEVSRLAVRKQFRKRKGDDILPMGDVSPDASQGQRRFPLIAMSLYWGAFCMALNLNLDVFAIMEPRLARHLRRCGLRYCLVSDLFELHGKRGIFYTKPPEQLQYLDSDTYDFFYLLNKTIAEDLYESGYISSPFPIPFFKFPEETVCVEQK